MTDLTTDHAEKVLPVKTCVLVYLVLMVLLVATTGLDFVKLGDLQTPAALVIAVIKAALVMWYFMHVKFSERLVIVAIVVALIMVSVAGTLTLIDYSSRL